MAVEFKPDKDKDKVGAPQQQLQVGGVQGAVGGAGGAMPAQQKGTSSGRFTNLQNYLKANQPGQFGQNLSSKVQQKAEDVTSKIDKERQEFQQKTQQSLQPFQGSEQFVQSALQDPTKFVQQDQQGLQRFDTIRSGVYQGPKELQNAGQLQAQTQNVQNLSKLGATEGGRFNLLRTMFNKPTYTRGQQTLDNLILQGGPTQGLQSLRRISAEAGRDLSTATQQALAEGQKATGEVGQAADLLRKSLTGSETDFTSGISKRVEDFRKEIGEREKIYRQNLSQRNELTDQDLSLLGIPENQRETFRFFYDMSKAQGDKERVSRVELMSPGSTSTEGGGNFGGTTTTKGTENLRILTGDAAQKYLGRKAGESVDGYNIRSIQQSKPIDLTQYIESLNPEMFTKENLATKEEVRKALALNRLGGRAQDQAFLTNEELAGNANSSFKYRGADAYKALQDYYASGFDTGNVEQKKADVITDDKLGDLINFIAKTDTDMTKALLPFTGIGDLKEMGLNAWASDPDRVGLTRGFTQVLLGNPGNAIISGKPEDLLLGQTKGYLNMLQSAPGAIEGTAKQLANINTYKSLLASSAEVAKNVINPLKKAEQTKRAAAAAAEAARKALSFINPFCLVPGTMIEMADGSFKDVATLELGDVVAFGGAVIGNGKAYTTSLYSYNDIDMSENHAIFHNGSWVRAKDCSEAKKIDTLNHAIVCPVVVEHHILVSNDVVLSDFMETNQGYGVNDAQRLEYMNANKEYAQCVKKELDARKRISA